MKKKYAFMLALSAFVVGIGVTVGASAAIKEIKAQLRPDFTIEIDGKEATFNNANGEKVYPILYDGTTYLPVRAIGEIMGKTVYWYEDEKRIELREATETTVTDADVIISGSAQAGTNGNKYKTKDPDKSDKADATPEDTEAFIGEEKAKEIALQKAGLTESEVIFEKAELDRDDGRYVYELEFRYGNIEYEAEINAKTGKILKFEKDIDD